jgi:putative cell wall-binding protein
MKKTKKALASLAIAGMVLSMAPMSVFGADATTTDRIFGADRIETAVKVAQAGWTTAATVIVAPAADANLVDALAAAPLAGQEKAPILLTDGAALDAKTKQAIVDLEATKVFAVGALSDQVVADLQGITGVTVEALKGADRIETAAKIVAKLSAPAGSFVVGYGALADALSVASFAAANNYSILVANPDGTLPASETAVGTKYVIGGPTLVADVAGAERLYGADRFATNKAVLNELSYEYNKAYVANGEDAHLVDSLVASSLAAKDKAAIVLGDMTSAAAAADVSAKLASDSQVVALGGTSVVSDAVKNSVKYNTPATLSIEGVSAKNGRQLVVTFNKAVDEDSVKESDKTLIDGIFEITRMPVSVSDADLNVDLDAALASLSDDGMTLTITAAASTATNYFDGTYAFHIGDGVTSTTGEDLGKYNTTLTFDDTTAPTITSVKYNSGTDKIEVVTSEPVQTAPAITVNGGAPKALDAVAATSTRTKFTFANTYTKGTEITVAASGSVDYLGNTQDGTNRTTVKIELVEEPVEIASLTQDSSNTVKVSFNHAIAGSTDGAKAAVVESALTVIRSGATFTAGNSDFAVTVDPDDSSKRTYIVTFDNTNAPDYDIYGDKDAVSLSFLFEEDGLTDVFGNTNDEISKSVSITKDLTGPTLVSAKMTSDKSYLELRFNEEITEATLGALAANVTVRKDGVDRTVDFGSAIVSPTNSKVISIQYTFAADLPNATYSVRVPADTISDTHGNNNDALTATVSVATADSTVTGSAANFALNSYQVTFTGDVSNSALEAANYTLNGIALPEGTDIYFNADKRHVVITLEDGTVNYVGTNNVPLRVANIVDTDGNKVDAFSDDVTVVDNVDPTMVSATLNGNVLTLTFDEDMAISGLTTMSALLADVEIKGGSITLNDSGSVSANVDGKKVVILLQPAAGSNWTTVKAASKITVETKTGSTAIVDSNNSNSIKKDVIVTVQKY